MCVAGVCLGGRWMNIRLLLLRCVLSTVRFPRFCALRTFDHVLRAAATSRAYHSTLELHLMQASLVSKVWINTEKA